MSKLILALAAIFPAVLSGQTSLLVDTIRIGEVFVKSSSKPAVLNGFRDQTLDSIILKDYLPYDISSVLSENTPLFVKNYGPGAIATTSFRGTGASQTQLLWNDISINSPMLGQADFSLVPAGFTDEIRILNGAASMIMGSGGLGGTVNFATKPDWKNETNLMVNGGAGSFGTYSGILRLRTGTDKFQSVTRSYVNSSVNNFSYLNDAGVSAPVMEHRKDAAVLMSDFMQEFYLRGEKSVSSATVWYSHSERQLPSNMLVIHPPGSETQQDESLRTMVSHDRNVGSLSVETSVAWFSDRLLYINRPASIYSNNRSNTFFARAAAETAVGTKSRLRIMLNNEYDFVNSVNYSDLKSRNISTLSVSGRTSIKDNLGFSILLRDIIYGGTFLIPDFSAGTDMKVIRKNDGFVRLNFSRNSRVPSMNDLYWNPGGNTALRNEYSYSGEIAFDMKNRITERFELSSVITFFRSAIRDLIQWIPGESSIWTPQNVFKVYTSGAEAGIGADYKTPGLALRLKIQYSLNLACKTGGSGENNHPQLIYVPENQVNASLGLDCGAFYGTFLTRYTGKRFTVQDNSEYLPGFILNNIIAGVRLKQRVSAFNISLRADNIFNVRYEAIAFYPMPGRSFMFSVTYKFIKPL